MKKILFAFILSSFFFVAKAQTLQEGIKHMENENYAAALNTFNAICKADPKNASVYYWIGEVSYLQDDPKEAEKNYRKGLSINPQCAECYVGVGKIQLDNGSMLEAEKSFASAIRINKKNAAIFGLIGDSYLYNKKPDAKKAIQYLSEARAMDTKVAKYWAHLGDAYKLDGNHGEAVTAYETAVEKDPSNSEAYISMARIWSAAKQYDLAIPHLEKAIQMSPNDARPIKDLYELYIHTGKYDKVVPLLDKYIALAGTDIDAKVRLVKFLTFQAKDYERAIIEGEKLLLTNPNQYTLHRWLAWSYVGQSKIMEAQKTDGKAIDTAKLEQYWLQAYKHSEELFNAIGKNDERKAFPEDYEYWALSAFKIGKLDDAAHIYRKYIEFEPSKASEIYGMLAKTYFDSTKYEQAINYYKRKAEGKTLTNAEDYYLGLSQYYLKQNLEADSSFARVLAVTPNFANGWMYRARIANRIDSTQTMFLAYPHFEKYIEYASLDPGKNKRGLIEAYTYMAFYAVQHDEIAKAKEYYELILALEPENDVAKANLEILKGEKRR